MEPLGLQSTAGGCGFSYLLVRDHGDGGGGGVHPRRQHGGGTLRPAGRKTVKRAALHRVCSKTKKTMEIMTAKTFNIHLKMTPNFIEVQSEQIMKGGLIKLNPHKSHVHPRVFIF